MFDHPLLTAFLVSAFSIGVAVVVLSWEDIRGRWL